MMKEILIGLMNMHGIVPWWLQTMLSRLTTAFKEKNQAKILKYAAGIGHYTADAHVPLHPVPITTGSIKIKKVYMAFGKVAYQNCSQKIAGIFFGKAEYIKNPADFSWRRVLESCRC